MSSRFFSRVLSRSVVRVVALCAVFVGMLWSCRTVDDEIVDGPETFEAVLTDFGDSHKTPQKALWKIGSDSGEAGLTHAKRKVVAWVDLDEVPRDTVWIEYWRAGVREQRSAFLFDGTVRLKWSGLSVMDPLVVEILRRIEPSTDSSRFDTAFARALVDNDSIARKYGFPQRFPLGLDTAQILRIAMVLMVGKERALAQIAPKSDWALGIDTLSVHGRVRLLCQEGVISDTSKIFPHRKLPQDSVRQDTGTGKPDTTKPDPGKPDTAKSDTTVKDTSKTRIDTTKAVDTLAPRLRIVDPGPESVFENFQDSIVVRVLATDTSEVDSVKVNQRRAVRQDSLWVLEKVFVPVLPDSLVVRVEAWDRAKNRSSATIQVRRKKPPPPKDPYHAILLPIGSAVPFDSTSVLARWIAYDPSSAVDSVRIGGIRAVREKDSTWSARVRLDSIGTPTTIRYVAWTTKGTSIVDSFKLTRLKDETGPSTRFVSPAENQSFDYTIDSVTLSVIASDPSGVASVKIAGVAVPDSSGHYQRRVGLVLGKTATIPAEARDAAGNITSVSITVTRKAPPDTLPPKIQRIWPNAKSGTLVPLDSPSVTLRWVVTDWFGLGDTSVRVGGVVVKGVHDTFSLRVSLPPTGVALSFRLEVVNVKGVSIRDTVSLARAKDTVRPVLVRKAGSRTVPFDSGSVAASWDVTDNHKLSTVTINGDTVSGDGRIYKQVIALDTGRNRVVIVALDSIGNQSTDTVVIIRIWKDTTPPVIVRREGTESRTIDFDSVSAKVSWKVADQSPLEVKINGEKVIGVDGIYTAFASLSQTVSMVSIVAIDSEGNSSADTVTITKLGDLKKPTITPTLETRSKTVDFQTESIVVGWTVKDNGVLRIVNIAGGENLQEPTDSAYTKRVPLEVGDNVIRINAVDQEKNEAHDSVVIHRSAASVQTRLQAEKPAPVSVLWRPMVPMVPMVRSASVRREKIFG